MGDDNDDVHRQQRAEEEQLKPAEVVPAQLLPERNVLIYWVLLTRVGIY